MKKVCISPFTRKEYSILSDLSDKYSIEALIAPKGIGIAGQDISILRNELQVGLSFTNSIREGIERAEVVIISQVPTGKKGLYNFAKKSLDCAVNLGKEIWCFLEISKEEENQILVKYEKLETQCKFIHTATDTLSKYSGSLGIKKFNVPVFFVSEMTRDCDGYDIFLKLAKALTKDHLNVLAISSDCYNELFGYEFVDFNSSDKLGDQVFRINKVVYDLYEKKDPDVILIRFPNPLMQYDDRNLFDCGVTAYTLTQAVPGDGCIACSLYDKGYAEFWNEYSELIEYRFGLHVIGVHVSRKMVDPMIILDSDIICLPEGGQKSNAVKDGFGQQGLLYNLFDANEFARFYKEFKKEYLSLPYGVI